MRKQGWVLVLLGVLALGLGAMGSGTPAGTEIRNQASATYLDHKGVQHTATSNEVVTIVSQVCGLSIVPDGDDEDPPNTPNVQYAAPGNTVYFSYTLTNTGNAPDTFQLMLEHSTEDDFDPVDVRVYLDVAGNGLVDPGDPLLTSGVDDYGDSTPTVAADGQIKLVVAYTVPSTAADGQVTRMNLVGRTDTCADDQVDDDNWNQTTVTEEAVVTATKSVVPTTVDPGDTVTYTISGSNTGNQPAGGVTVTIDDDPEAGILISDELPAFTTLLDDPAPSGSPFSGYVVYSTDDGDSWSESAPGDLTDLTHIGWFIPEDGGVALDPGQGYSFTFTVQVASDAPMGYIENTADVLWDDQETTTNRADVYVNRRCVVSITPDIDAGTRAAGSWVTFRHTVTNESNAPDTINIAVDSKPNDWQVLLYKSDGITPLADTNADGIPDVGLLGVGDSRDVIVKAFIPYTETGSEFEIVIGATAAQGGCADEAMNTVTDVVQVGVALGNNLDPYPTYTEVPQTETTDPDACVDFPLLVVNRGGTPDTFDLFAEGLPDGWTNTFYRDAEMDGEPDSTDPISAVGPLGGAVLTAEATDAAVLEVTSTSYFAIGDVVWVDLDDDGSVTNAELFEVTGVNTTNGTITIDDDVSAPVGARVGEVTGVVARVCVPPGAEPGDTPITFRATSNNDSTVSSTIENTVIVNVLAGVKLTPDRAGTGAPGGTVVYEHTLCNTGNEEDTFTLTYESDWNWTYTYSVGDQEGDTVDVTLGPDQCIPVRITGFIPSNAAIDQVDVVVLTATSDTDGSVTDSANDVTRVIQGVLKLTKVVEPDGDQPPGTLLTYTTAYKNLGNAAVGGVIIYDAIPAHTTYELETADGTVPAGQLLFSYSTDGGLTWEPWQTDAPDAAGITNLRWGLDLDGNGNVDEDDLLLPGQSGEVTFQVTIDD